MNTQRWVCTRMIRIVVLALGVLPGAGAHAAAQGLDKETETRVREATVQVWIGEAAAGQEEPKWLGSGSGCFINSTGLAVTNNHVVDPGHGKPPAMKFKLRNQLSVLRYAVVVNSGTPNEATYKATVCYQNESADLALLQVEGTEGNALQSAHYLNLFPARELRAGDSLWCFGFPGGDKMSTSRERHAEVSVSRGNIIGLPKTPGGRIPQIDTDVKAAPGSSGGPQVNAEGELIGILSQGTVSNATGDGILIRVIPADLVADMVKVAHGRNRLAGESDLKPFHVILAGGVGAAPAPLGLAERLALDTAETIEIAKLVDDGELTQARQLLDRKLEKPALKAMPQPVREQVQALAAEWLLRTGDASAAEAEFRRLRRAKHEHVEWYGEARALILKEHGGEKLSDPAVFQDVAARAAATFVRDARRTLSAYRQAMPDSHNDWKKLIRDLEAHEYNLRIANSLAPGSGENDIFRIWRFCQNLNAHEYRRLFDDIEQWERKREDFKNDGTHSARDRARSLNSQLERLKEQFQDVARAGDDLQEKMNSAGFRLDDPAAAEILD